MSAWQDRIPQGVGGVVRFGLASVFGFLGLLLVWGFAAPLASAVIGHGQVISAGQNQLVQHPRGGVVRRLHVPEGARVARGDVIVTLDHGEDQAALTQLLARRERLEAERDRLRAERGGVAGLSLRGTGGDLRAEQAGVLDAGRARLSAQQDAAEARIDALTERREGLRRRLATSVQLRDFAQAELARLRPLVEDGIIAASRLRDVDRDRLRQTAEVEQLRSEVLAMEDDIAQAQGELALLQASDDETRGTRMTAIMGELAEISDRLSAAQAAVEATRLRAPVSGTVTGLTARTVGGVVPQGEAVAAIVPDDADLEAEFRVQPSDVARIAPGQAARLQVSAFDMRAVAPFAGTVSYVAADSIRDPATGEIYFTARIAIDSAGHDHGDRLRAGMAGDIFVEGRSRSFIAYLLEPVTRSFSKAFRQG